MTKRKNHNWKELIVEHERSGKSVREYCKGKGIAANLFYVNRKKLQAQEFVEVAVRKVAVEGKPLVLTYRGVRIGIEAGFCKETLEDVLAVIRGME